MRIIAKKSALILLAAALALPALAQEAQTKDIVFPPPPDKGRVKWEATYNHTKHVAGKKPGFFKKVWWAITGKAEMEGRTLVKPFDVVTWENRIYVSDTLAKLVVVFDRNMGKVWSIGRKEVAGMFGELMGIDVDDDGNLYAADAGQAKVKVYGPDGSFIRAIGQLGEGEGQLKRPLDVAYDRFGKKLAVVDRGRSKIVFYDLKGKFLFEIGGKGSAGGQFLVPVQATWDRQGRLLVVDAFQCRVQIFGSDGTYQGSFGECGDSVGYMVRPKGIATDSYNNIYVTDSQVNIVQIFSEDGEILLAFGGLGSVPGRFYIPAGIHIDSRDRVYVADAFNARVEVYKVLDGRVPEDKKTGRGLKTLADEGWDIAPANPSPHSGPGHAGQAKPPAGSEQTVSPSGAGQTTKEGGE